jgi:hypothetical protein
MSFLTTAALIFWAVIFLICVFILIKSDSKGARRVKSKDFEGDDRRKSIIETDWTNCSIFRIHKDSNK